MHHTNADNTIWNPHLISALVTLPAVALGIFAMISSGGSSLIWMQQAAAFFIFALLGTLRRFACRLLPSVWLSVLMPALAATLLFPAIGGTRRWLDLEPFILNAAMLVLPALLALLCNMEKPWAVLLNAAVVLCL